MRKPFIFVLCLVAAWPLTACSPRDLLSRRLAADLIEGSDAFKTPQSLLVRTGVVSNKDYLSPESLVLQHHGWISATTAPCPPALAPPPCWDVVLTPSGVETVRTVACASRRRQTVVQSSGGEKRTGRHHRRQQTGQCGRCRFHLEMAARKRSGRRSLFQRLALPLHRRIS